MNSFAWFVAGGFATFVLLAIHALAFSGRRGG
jgi:hypothetical protein